MHVQVEALHRVAHRMCGAALYYVEPPAEPTPVGPFSVGPYPVGPFQAVVLWMGASCQQEAAQGVAVVASPGEVSLRWAFQGGACQVGAFPMGAFLAVVLWMEACRQEADQGGLPYVAASSAASEKKFTSL